MRKTTIAALAALALAPIGARAQQPPAQANWSPSRYGADDQIGAMNLLTPQKVLEAARLVTRGQVYRLGVPVGRDTPACPPRSASVTVMMPDQFGGTLVPSENKVSYADDMFVGWLGVGSQIDSFAHLGIDNTFDTPTP